MNLFTDISTMPRGPAFLRRGANRPSRLLRVEPGAILGW